MAETKPKFRVLVGINYVPIGKKTEVRKEPGSTITDLPRSAVRWLLEQGLIEEVK